MEALQKDLMILDLYLTTCQKKGFLADALWLAFNYKEKNPKWDILKCFETAIWDWLLFSEDNKKPLNPEEFVKKVNKLKKQKKRRICKG